MTEQVAIKHIEDHFDIHNDGRPHPFLDEAVSMAIKALKDRRWIPCSERLPEVQLTYDIFKRPTGYISDPVLVTVKSKEVGGTRYYVATDIMTGRTMESVDWLKSCGYGGSAVYSQEIIAWQPLPEAYKPEMEEA